MGIFDKFKKGFQKSASAFSSGLKEIVIKKEIDDENLNKIEEFLIQSDVGIEAANEIKKIGRLDWDAEALVENYYDEIGKIVDKLEKLLNDEELILGNAIDDLTTGPGGVEAPITLGEVSEMNMTNQEPRFFEDL